MEQLLLPGLLLYLVFREVLHFRQINNMLDRLMARDLPEYKAETQPEENQITDAKDDDTIDIEDAEEVLTGDGEGN